MDGTPSLVRSTFCIQPTCADRGPVCCCVAAAASPPGSPRGGNTGGERQAPAFISPEVAFGALMNASTDSKLKTQVKELRYEWEREVGEGWGIALGDEDNDDVGHAADKSEPPWAVHLSKLKPWFGPEAPASAEEEEGAE